VNTAAKKWAHDLSAWGIPQEILDQAPESPWIHPPAVFTLPEVIADSPSHQRAREVLPEGGSVLDVGCGGGIATYAIAPPAGTVIGVDHQQEMLDMFAGTAIERGLQHQEIFGDWPAVADQAPVADVVTCHHVVYNVSDIEPFLRSLDAHASKRVVIEMPQNHPLASRRGAWQHFWQIERPVNPTPHDLMDVLAELGISAHLELWDGPNVKALPLEDEVRFLRIRLCLDSSKDQEIREFIAGESAPSHRSLATIWWDKH